MRPALLFLFFPLLLPAHGQHSGYGDMTSARDVAINTAGALGGSWFRQQDSMVKRIGELRICAAKYGTSDVWTRAYGQQSDVDMRIHSVADFREYIYGADLGTDRIYRVNATTKAAMGFFAGYERMDRRHHDQYRSRSSTDSLLGGAYFSLMEKNGWYADFAFKGQSFDNDGAIRGIGADQFQYTAWGIGASAELGRTYALGHAWFIEPMAKVAWHHLGKKNYRTDGGIPVSVRASDAWLVSGLVRAGRTDYCGLGHHHFVQSYVKAGVNYQTSNGGSVRMPGYSARPSTDEARAVAGLGMIWQYEQHQIHVSFEAAVGEKVDIPWSINAGYRLAF